MKLPPLNAVRVFECAARHLSFALAAEELHVTPPAVSHQIKLLEEALGRPLFVRHTRSVALTAEAEAYLPVVRTALQQISDASRQLQRLDSNLVTISVAPGFASGWLVQRLPGFYAVHPDIDIQINTSMRMIDFTQSDVDLAVRYGRGTWRGLECRLLLEEELVVVCSPELYAKWRGRLDKRGMRQIPLIHSLPKAADWPEWYAREGIKRTDPSEGLRLANWPLALEAALSGLGFAVTNLHLVRNEIAQGRLTLPLKSAHLSESAYYLVWPRERNPGARVVAFREWILTQASA
ncbi:MAG: transcriptional regulator GcvA [Gammaproteobacteria bacterium]|nr:transcriptional regulator GcvA [Gammaproteobacteria bacterium]